MIIRTVWSLKKGYFQRFDWSFDCPISSENKITIEIECGLNYHWKTDQVKTEEFVHEIRVPMKKENVAVIENHVYDFKCPLNYGYRDCDAVIPEIKKTNFW